MGSIVVTGANGFVGIHTVKELLRRGYNVTALDIETDKIAENFLHEPKCKYECVDICNPNLENFISPGDRVLHLAAIARFADCEKYPLKAQRVNVEGTLNVLMACKNKKADRIVYSSTGSVYSRDAPIPIREDAPRGQVNIYGSTKKMAEDWIFYFGKRYRLPFVILRYGYVYGRGKYHGAIGSFIKLLEEGKAPTIFGGEQVNDFVYIKDVVEANILALETAQTFQTFNIGSGRARSIRDCYDLCAKFMSKKIEPIIEPPRVEDFPVFIYDILKARTLLGFQPKWSLEVGIEDMLKH